METITHKNILGWYFDSQDLSIEVEQFDQALNFNSDKFWAWFENTNPAVCSEYLLDEEVNIEEEYWCEKCIDREKLKNILTESDMSEFVNFINISNQMLDGGFVDVLETIKNLKIAA